VRNVLTPESLGGASTSLIVGWALHLAYARMNTSFCFCEESRARLATHIIRQIRVIRGR
jgi:hypothetical protein